MIHSEISALQSVILHRPGKELENLTPDLLERLLFDDIPYLKVAQDEHDVFAKTLQDNGVEVLYITDLLCDVLENDLSLRESFLRDFLDRSTIQTDCTEEEVKTYFAQLSTHRMVTKMIEGVRKCDVMLDKEECLLHEEKYPFCLDPIPNLLFQRDPCTIIGKHIVLHHMNKSTRQRETIFSEYVFRYHARFNKYQDNIIDLQKYDCSSEGGDVLVISPETILIGVSERTDLDTIKLLTSKLFNRGSKIKNVYAIKIPKDRSMMHLDTVLTQVDAFSFAVHKHVLDELELMHVTVHEGNVVCKKLNDSLQNLLSLICQHPVELIYCGGKDVVTADREQWNDATNTLALAEGVVVTYDRNQVTNKLLKTKGITVLEVPSSELSRGRGGPRCMSMPISRKEKTF